MWYATALIGTSALAIWLALTDSSIWALPLVIVIAALARAVVRSVTGKRLRPADIASRRADARQDA